MKENFIICIGREPGSGGREVGRRLASQLNISFYDKELIRIASRESGLGEEYFEKADEQRRFTLFGAIPGLKGSLTDDYYTGFYLSNETLFKIQSDIIRSLAEKESCLFVGRCADYILKEHPGCFNVFICALKEDRIRRIAENRNMTMARAKAYMDKTDKRRADYYNYFTGKKWGQADSYDLCINSSGPGVDGTVQIIKFAAQLRFGI